MESREFWKDELVEHTGRGGVWRIVAQKFYGSSDGGHALTLAFVAGAADDPGRLVRASSRLVRKLTEMEVIALAAQE